MSLRSDARLQKDNFFMELQIRSMRNSMLRKFPGIFYPPVSFYADWDGDEDRLKRMLNTIFNYLNLPIGLVECNYMRNLGSPGVFSWRNGQQTISIDETYKTKPLQVAAILAHESMHVYMHREKLETSDVVENELRTDISSILVGLGILIVNGMSYENPWFLSVLLAVVGVRFGYSKTSSLGYFEPKRYIRMFKEELNARGIRENLLKKFISPNARPLFFSFQYATYQLVVLIVVMTFVLVMYFPETVKVLLEIAKIFFGA